MLTVIAKKPTKFDSNRKRRPKADYFAHNSRSPKSGKIVSFITIVVVNEAEKIVPVFEKISEGQLRDGLLVQLDIVTKVPQAALSETAVRKKDERYELIFLDFSENGSSFSEDEEIPKKLTSNGFIVKTVRCKPKDGELQQKVEEWFYSFLRSV